MVKLVCDISFLINLFRHGELPGYSRVKTVIENEYFLIMQGVEIENMQPKTIAQYVS